MAHIVQYYCGGPGDETKGAAELVDAVDREGVYIVCGDKLFLSEGNEVAAAGELLGGGPTTPLLVENVDAQLRQRLGDVHLDAAHTMRACERLGEDLLGGREAAVQQ